MKMCAVRYLTLLVTAAVVDCSLTVLNWKAATSIHEDYDTVDYPRVPVWPASLKHWSHSGMVPSTGRNYTVHVGSLQSGLPSAFSFQLPKKGCCHIAKTSATASMWDCTYATNAGFFNMHRGKAGCCMGNLVMNGIILQLITSNRVNIGLNGDHFVMGYLRNSSIKDMKFSNLISGAGWLVRKGLSYINTSIGREELAEQFVHEKAPRTAMVVHEKGSLSLVQVDGEEDIATGLDLFEFSEVLVKLGAWQAINLDGGGSSVSVLNGRVISKPTCLDIPVICERAVSSIACMKLTHKHFIKH